MADNQQYGPLAPKQNSASDIRSVIANATKKSGAGMTIATKDELNQKKVSNTNGLSNKNIVNTTNTKVNPNIAKVNNTKPTSVITPKTTKAAQPTQQQGTKMSSLIQGQVSGDLFKNPAVQPINNVKVEQINGKNQNLSDSYVNYHLDKNEIKNMLVETPEEKKKRQSEGVEKLYIDAYRKKKDGGVLTVEDVLGNANYQKELNGIEQGVLQEMVNDANTLANAGKFNMDNAMALFDKYQDLGIQIDYNKLSPESKAQFVGDMLNNKQSTLGKIISWATPMGQISNIKELITGKSMTDDILDTITKLEESSHKNLTDKDTDKIASKQIKKLDEAYKDFYDMGKKAPSLIDYATNIKNVGDLYYKHKYGVDEDQKIWKDKDKEKEYNEELNKIRSAIKEQHGDTAANVARNTLIGSAKALLTVANMASDLPSFGKMIWDLGKGGVEDTVGAIASVGKTAYDTAKYAKDTGDFEVQWDAKDIRQRVAEAGGYDNYNDFVAKVEQEMGGSPLGQFLAWSLKDADTSMNTANALGNYFIEKYGTLDDGLTAFKNDPVEATSDWIPWGQFNVKLLEKLGLISSAKANKIIEASRWMDAYDKPFELVNKFQFGPLLKMEGKLLGGVSKLGLGTINLPFKLVSRAVDAVFSKLTGIDKESRNFIRENPDEVLSYVNGEKTSDGILRDIKDKFDEITDEKRQIGEEYEAIKNNDVPVKSKEILDNIMNTLSEFGVKISDKGVEYTKILPQFVEKNVKELLRFVDDYKKKGETPSASETHYFRQLVDTLAKWESNTPAKGIEAQFINSVKDIRRTIDNALKEQVPGMKEADAAYSAALDTIKELRRDWFDKDGTLKDSAYSRIRNLTNKGSNQPKLERLESVIPGITKQLKSLAVSEVIERGMKQATGQYLNQIASGAGLGAIASLLTGGVSLPTLIIGALGMMYATPENFAHLLRFEGKVTKPIRDIANKISNRTKLTAKETSNLVDFMLDNQERLGKTAQYMYEKGLLEEPMKASDIKAPKSKDPTLKELTEYKESLKKDLKEGKISQKYYDDEIHGKNGEPGIDYAIAQKKARTKIGDKEKVLSAEDKERVTNFIKKRANDVGFVTKMFEHLPYDEGFTVLRKKLIAFSKNPGNTTSQHELFHAFFSVVDNKTKTYLIQEARKILKDNGMAIKDAEEWLAESFGIYAKRKMIDLGMIKNAPKGVVDKFVSTLRNFFQRVYEYMQKFNGDRATINKIFDEVLGEKQMKDGIMDLSDLLGDKKLDKKLLREIELGDNGLRNKSVYHGSPADFDKFDSSHMGEGEGAQAHGWGHYVAVNKKTAEHYANRKYSSPIVEYKGKTDYGRARYVQGKGLVQPKLEDVVAKDVALRIQSGLSFKEAVEKELEKSKNLIERPGYFANYKAIEKNRMKILNNLKESDFRYDDGVGKRNLYSLDIPDPVKADTPTGSNYLEEGDIITEKAALGFVKKLNELDKNLGKDLEESILFEDNGKYNVLGYVNGEKVYNRLEDLLGSDKKASKFLESIGYDGIHYNGGRDGEAYVIFNDDALQIKDHIRYKKSGLEQKEQTKSKEFKNWFGDWEKGGKNVSKVVNADGTPKVVYHGTANKFNEFKQLPGYRGGAGLGVLGDGFYFTDSKKTAKSYSKEKTNNPLKLIFGGNIMETYLDIKKPYELKYTWDADIPSKKDLKAKGYDGIIADMPSGEKYYVAFEPNQIKSATDNVGTFDKNSNDIRYKKKIGDKDVEITPKVTSPDELIEKNADGLSVMKSFISEKQAEKALNVNKALLDKDGNPYLWTHTNKYDAPQFANFENTKDSKYKEFSDYEIAFFSNSEEMSKSYAKGKSKLANTKGYKDVEDFNKQNLTVEKSKSDQTTRKGVKIPTEYELSKGIRIIEGKSGKARIENVIEHKYVLDTSLDKLLDDMDIAKEGYMPDNDTKHVLSRKERIERVKWEFAGNYSWGKWDVDVKELPNGKVEVVKSKNNILPEEYDSVKAAMAEYTASKTEKQPYHYQGIVTDVKNPLVVDLGKKDYGLKDWKTGEKYNTGRGWNDLDTAYDLLEKYDKEGLKKLEKVNELFNKTFGELSKKRKEILGRTSELRWEYSKRYDDFNDYHLGKGERTEKNLTKLKQLDSDMANALNASFSINRLLGGEIKEINSDILEFIKSHDDYNKVYNDVLDFLKNNKDNLEYISYGDKRKDFKDWLINNGLDEDVATLLHDIRLSGDDDIIELLKNKDLQTNDYVFYALKNGGYDGVIFKDILDFGSNDAFDKAQNKGGDVLVTFKSKDFKAWDNANPTDSKYISYKKKVSLDKKPEGLQKKDSNGLLAKGRERMGDNGMRYKKSEYEQAVESGDKEKALGMIRKAAAEKGYDSSSDYQGSKAFNGSAPSSEGYTKAERINPDTEMYSQTLGDYASDGVDIGDLDWQLTDRGNYIRGDEYIRESIDNLNKAVREYKAGNKNAKIKMYRAIDADIKENGFRNGDWITPSKKYAKMHIGLQDWKKGRIIEEEVPIENIWWDNNDINEWGYDDGKEYGYKNTPNNKKELGITYDDKGKLIPLEKRFDEKNPDVRFKKKGEVPEDKKLVGLHNLGIDKLRGVIELGGMPMPSIAVTKKGVPHESYGDITFIMKESAINPALSRKNKLYTVDGYTPTVPQPTIRVKDTKEANLLMDKIQKETGIGYGELMQWLEYHDDRYFKDYPKLKEFDKYYDQLTEKKLFDGFTYTGKRRYKDYNLDNIVKSMVGNKRDAFNGAFWKMVAQSQGNTTVEKLRDRKYGLKDKDLAEKIGEKYYDALKELASKKGIEQKIESLSDYGRFAENVSDAYRANTDAWWRELTQWDGAEKTIYSKITKEDLEPLQKIIKEAAELPRPYSEAKPERAIRFDEVGAVVAPEGKLKEVKDMLKDTGLKVYGYKEGERMSVVDKVADDNGLRFKKGYHGSPYSFDKFDEKRIGKGEGSQVHGYGLYIAGTKDTAKKYAEMGRRDSFFKGQPISKFLKSKEGKVYTKAERDAIKQVGEYIPDYSPEEAIDQLKEDLYPARTPYEKEVIRALDRLDWKDFESGRNLYDVDIPDEVKRDTPSGTNYLDEEKLYGKKVYEKIFEEAKKSPEWKNTKGVDGYIADRLKFKGDDKMYGVWIRQALEYGFQNDKEASKFLQSLGYDGIEYTGLEDGKSYVLFKGSDIDITNHIRYKKGLTAKDQTQTPEFKKWFEGSKVVDKSGKPLVMYHGTNSDFNTFDKGLIKSQNWGKGFYFTSNKEDAKQYGKNTKAVYLDVKNPLDLTSGENEAEYNKWYGKKNSPYDGYVVNFSNGDKMVVVKSPNQIKSATDNIGTFDKNNPDIRYKKGLEKKENGLERKKVSTASSFQSRVDNIANELGVKGGNTVQKMKRINKIIKEDKYKGTDIKKRFYQLKWEYKKQYIINNDKKIKDKGFKRTTLRVWQNGKKADWHFTKKQYEELKELGYIE